jgi:glycerol-3-phosphate cytidylyltransferase-like family protein
VVSVPPHGYLQVCPERERIATVRGCKWVDEVVEGVPYVMSDEYLRYVIEKYRYEEC